jgi:hypothetical protein
LARRTSRKTAKSPPRVSGSGVHRAVNCLGREDRFEEDIQEQIILKAPEEFDEWEEV